MPNFGKLWEVNPGLIAGGLMTLEFVFEWGLRTLIWNPWAEGVEMAPAKSEDDSMLKTFAVIKENPGILFFVAAIAGKYLGYNPSASKEYGDYLGDRSPEHLAALWKANPGLIAGGLMTLEFVFEWGLRTLIWNPWAKGVDMAPATSDQDSMVKTFGMITKNPGVLYFVVAIAAKYLGYNPSASKEYGDYLGNRSLENFGNLWKANPGLVAGGLMTLEFVFEWGLRTLIWNPSAESMKHLAPAASKDDSVRNTFAVFSENPGLLFAVVAIAGKYLGFNPSASDEYSKYLGDRSPTNFAKLWEANPGLLVGALMSLEFVFEWGMKSLLWNPEFAAKDFMFAKDSGLKDIGLVEVGKLSDKWPGFIYGMVLLAVKYGIVNFSARDEYLDAFKAVGGASELGKLFQKSPGVAAMSIFIIIKFFEELGAKILFDPRLIEEYNKFWDNPSQETAKGLFASGVVAAALFSIGKGIDVVWVKGKSGLSNLLETKEYNPT